MSQLRDIHDYLQDHTATATMVTLATGIPQKCVTRHKRTLEKMGRLWELEKKPCRRTGYRAWYLTTDPLMAEVHSDQLSLFNE